MADVSASRAAGQGAVSVCGLPAELGASSLLSSRWSRDNLLTPHPSRLYNGDVLETIGSAALPALLEELAGRFPGLKLIRGGLGVFTWDLTCSIAAGGEVLVQVPRALDEPGARGRTKREAPALNVANISYYQGQGLSRFAVRPRESLTLLGGVPAACFDVVPGYHPLAFAAGTVRVDVDEGAKSWGISLGARGTAEALAEVVATIAYHYEPDLDGGTALTDFYINDGDFVVKRGTDGGFDVRLLVARCREPGISPALLVLCLLQLTAFEDFWVGDSLSGLPVLASNPAVAFEGLVRGLCARYRDLGQDPARARGQARGWIADFGDSREGRAYRPWVQRYLAGDLPLAFGEGARERWWRLSPFKEKLNLERVRAVAGAPPAGDASALARCLERLGAEIQRPAADVNPATTVNDLDGDALRALLSRTKLTGTALDRATAEFLRHWPYRSLDRLLALAPLARGLRRQQQLVHFGRVVSEEDDATLRSLPQPPKGKATSVGHPGFANPELYVRHQLSEVQVPAAVETFHSFESFLDQAMHDPAWGYYAKVVRIGRGGHFSTHPESLSPHYGRWLARSVFRAWREFASEGPGQAPEAFAVVEFGAGNGRLARDFVDGVRHLATDARNPEQADWQAFDRCLRYHIYETSAALRDKQRELLGEDALVLEGDARAPALALERDFPQGLRGVVLSNEVPDTFGVHKVALAPDGCAEAALVVGRVEAELAATLDEALLSRVREADAALRMKFAFQGHASELYLDRGALSALMAALAARPLTEREAALGAVWFEELYVPVSAVPPLALHLRANAEQYATALAAADSGVVLYINLHADAFVVGVAGKLAAGYIVTIDYGDTTWGLVQGARQGEFPLRVYCDGPDYLPRPNDPYTAPGLQDVTTDVNFTSLARAGQQAALQLVHFGHERDILGEELPVAVASVHEERFAELLGNDVFKVLVLGTRATKAFESSGMSRLSLLGRPEAVPKARRERIERAARVLRGDASAG